MNSKNRRRRQRSGFTLMEVLLVLAILVVLASMVTLYFVGLQSSSYASAARTQMGTFEQAIDFYRLHTNRYPTKLESLIRRPSDLPTPEKWQGPYLKTNEVPKDPWDNDYVYNNTGNQYYEIVCFGPDAAQGGDDDIVVTNKLDNQ